MALELELMIKKWNYVELCKEKRSEWEELINEGSVPLS